MRVVVIRHHDVDSAGFIAEAFQARGAVVRTYLCPGDDALPDLSGVDHVVVCGAIQSVNDDLSWIAAERDWLRAADRAGIPIFGICFGAQQLSILFGGGVERAPRSEIGWFSVDTLAPDLVPAGPWLEYHYDRCLPSPGVRVLASNELCVQAFTIGKHLAVQFHPEVDGEQLKRWLDAGGYAQTLALGLDPDAFLAQTIREEPSARARARVLVETALSLAR
ncbi:MAG TPA: type 1 glutamine amidotransferase [Streptosporangiaceae bacterium]|nr:type 1 glutamine amidotransferase [Streptosporangiaceae bacterium]